MAVRGYKHILVFAMVGVFIVPQITLAAWWNPFTWKVFKRVPRIQTQQVENATTSNTSSIPSVSAKPIPARDSKESENKQPKVQVQNASPVPMVQKQIPKNETKNSIVGLPNGALVEMDANGNIVRFILQPADQPSGTFYPQIQTNSVNATPTSTPVSVKESEIFKTPDAFLPEISIDKEEVKNDGKDFVTLKVLAKLSNGKIVVNKLLKIKTYLYNGGASIEPSEQIEPSNSQGELIFQTKPTKYTTDCGLVMFIRPVVI